MCFSLAEGGKRCDIKKRIYRSQSHFNRVAEKHGTVDRAIKYIETSGKPQVILNGKTYRLAGLIREREKLSSQGTRIATNIQELQRHHELTNQGIVELRAKSEDERLPIEQRKHYGAIANSREVERVRTLTALEKKRRRELNLKNIMKADGFDDATIKECNIEISVNKYPRSAKVYKGRIAKAVNEMQAIEKERIAILKSCKPNHRPSVESKYAEQLAEANTERLEAQYGYDSTVEGLAELKSQAEDRSVKMTQYQRHMLVSKYELAQERHNADKRDRNNRDARRNAIKRAYKEKGLDPSVALKAHKVKVIADNGGRVSMHPSVVKNIRRTVLLTEAEEAKVEADFRASGYKNKSAYIEAKLSESPTLHYQDKSITQLNSEAQRFSNGEAHRQWTDMQGRRSFRTDTKVNLQSDENFAIEAQSLHMSKSSLGRCKLLGIDPRQIQNDRSDLTNEIKTSMMMDMARKAS